MRWLPYTILIVLVVALQTTVAPRLAWMGAVPDWILVLVVFYAMNVPARHSLPCGWCAGALADLMSVERFGLLSLTYGCLAAGVCAIRGWVFVRHPLTQFGVTLAGVLAIRLSWGVYCAAVGQPGEPVGTLIWTCIYTACWAPLLHGALLRASPLLGLGRPGAVDRDGPRLGGHRV
ncbi:MAG: rod shape-determining protein MreD [Phycisphaerae bacterium]